jgi:hypothetical protein
MKVRDGYVVFRYDERGDEEWIHGPWTYVHIIYIYMYFLTIPCTFKEFRYWRKVAPADTYGPCNDAH